MKWIYTEETPNETLRRHHRYARWLIKLYSLSVLGLISFAIPATFVSSATFMDLLVSIFFLGTLALLIPVIIVAGVMSYIEKTLHNRGQFLPNSLFVINGKLKRQNPPSLFDRCSVLVGSKRYEEAINLLRKHIESKKTPSRSAYSWLGHCHFCSSQYDRAIEYFRMALDKCPDDNHSRICLAYSRVMSGESCDGNEEFQKVLSEAGEGEQKNVLIWGAHAAECVGHYDSAVNRYELLLSDNPDDMDALHAYALLLATAPGGHLRDAERSIEYAERVCNHRNWIDWQSLSVLAAAHAEAGDFKEATKSELIHRLCR